MASSTLQSSGRGMEAAEAALLSLQSKTAEALQQSALTRHLVCIQMHSYLQRLQLDLSQLRVVHVAGTKGKGSTCAFAESVLRRCGLSTGLFTSPHLIHVTERFKLDGRSISDELYLRHFWAVWDKLHATAVSDWYTASAVSASLMSRGGHADHCGVLLRDACRARPATTRPCPASSASSLSSPSTSSARRRFATLSPRTRHTPLATTH